ncbi:PQQ-dependent sugar dehydrogenase [Actinophytocola sp. S1-96]|uniref:PQQ-dependent sugar dehydrogenase n=1 Tax=Actinophytocola gossypii TaxID=2812003 RepID=A0ABT2JJL0_9PSEU|nr:PQQ-dependent sugar dehydrogenase [Actinophytocola gossypii]
MGRPAQAAPVLEDGFVLQEIPTGMEPPSAAGPGDLITDFGYLPDQSLIATGKFGKVMWVPETGEPRQLAMLPTNATGDLGLTGFAVAPDYATSRAVYTGRVVDGTGAGSGAQGVMRLSRWTVTVDAAGDPTGLTDEQVILRASADSNVHGVGSVIAAEDGSVWVSIGDSAHFQGADPLSLRALDIDDPHGKLLRLRPDGTGVPTNPYFDPANPRSARSLVYASGFRSPFRFSLDPVSGRPLLGDVGMGSYEEINLVNAGASYGWPCWEGNQRTPVWREVPECAAVTGTAPLWTYPRSEGSSVTGGIVYTGETYPEAYRGRYFFGDYTSPNHLWTLRFDDQGRLVTPPEDGGLGSGVGRPVKFAAVPGSGDIAFADIGAATIRRLVYAPGNHPPTAVITSTVDPATRTVTFDGSGSYDPNNDPLGYEWDFGDGTTGTGATVTHTYGPGESFTATLTVRESRASDSATATVYPGNHPPELTLSPPDPEHRFVVGETITATGSATDAEDGALPVDWSAKLVHCRGIGNCHDHPGEQQQGPTFTMPFEGHPGDTHLEITAAATDSRGAVAARTFVVHPKQRRITIESSVAAAFTIGDEQTSSGLFTVGSVLTIVAPGTAADGVATFEAWADGDRNRVRELRLGDADQTLGVTYLTPIDRRYAGDEALRNRLGAPTLAEQGDTSVRWREYAGGRMYWTPAHGAKGIFGGILTNFLAVGGHPVFGAPITDELPGAGGGVYTLFAPNGSGGRGIFWTPGTGAKRVAGAIYSRYDALDRDRGVLGYPTTNETCTATGCYNHFQRGSIFWSRGTGAHDVRNAIRGKWAALGWERGFLGYPYTGETPTPDGLGAYNHFRKGDRLGSIYWSRATGAHEVHGPIRARWAARGWERSYLGYPTSDEFAHNGIRRHNFQGGYILYDPRTGSVSDHRH